mgnify:CR=1 FL=1
MLCTLLLFFLASLTYKFDCTDKSIDTNAILDMKYDGENDRLYFVDSNGFLTLFHEEDTEQEKGIENIFSLLPF